MDPKISKIQQRCLELAEERRLEKLSQTESTLESKSIIEKTKDNLLSIFNGQIPNLGEENASEQEKKS